MTKVLQLIEIDVSHCSLTYGVSPCQASLGGSPEGATIKCFNSLGTCQDRVNFTDVPVTYRYMEDVQFKDEIYSASYPSDYSLLIHADGVDASTSIVDETGRHTITVNGNAQIDTAQSKFGVSSILFDGTGDYLQLGASSDFAFGTGDWTIDFWIRFNSVTTTIIYDDRTGDPQVTPVIYYDTAFKFYTNGSDRITGTTTAAPNTWYHIAVARSGTSTKLFVNGTQEGSTYSDSNNYVNSASPVIGARFSFSSALNGWMDEIRITKGTAYFTSNFTVPTSAYAAFTSYYATDPTMKYDALALIKSIDFQPAIVSFDGSIGQRAQLKVTFRDAPFPDNTDAYDKYRSERTYDPWTQGSYWGKFRARNPFMRGRALRYYQGEAGADFGSFEERLFLIDSINGPNANGEFQIIAKDTLKLSSADRAQAPFPSESFLSANIDADDVTVTVSGALDNFPGGGEAVIGGSEVVTYFRGIGGNDSNTKFLVHFSGNQGEQQGTTNCMDVSGGGHGNGTGADAGFIDYTQSKFGAAWKQRSGNNDNVFWPDSTDWQFGSGPGTGNFTFELWMYMTTVGGNSPKEVFGQHVDANNFMRLELTAAGALTFFARSGGSTILTVGPSANGAFVAATWQHIAVERRASNRFDIYVNGVSVANSTQSPTLPNLADSFGVGYTGGPGFTISTSSDAWVDEIRLSNVARYGGNFTPPTSFWGASTEVVLHARGQRNTEAASHSAQDTFQPMLVYTAQDPVDIIADLLETYAFVDTSYIPITDWQTESNAFSAAAFSLAITEPTGVDELISEILEQVGGALWWDDINHVIKFQIIRAIDTDADRYNEDNVLADTMEVREQPEKRISQVYVYFAQIDPTQNKDETNNYRSFALVTDAESEADEGSAMIKKIFARGIPTGGRSIATAMANNWLSRFTVAPRRFNFEVLRYAGNNPTLGLGVQLGGGEPSVISWPFQDETGDNVSIPTQITRVGAKPDRWVVEAEEMLSTIVGGGGSPDRHTVILDANQYNVNLRTIHDALYGTPLSGTTVDISITSGTIIGSTSTSSPAVEVGTWPGGVTINLYVRGRIEGAGGLGGYVTFGPVVHNGEPGGLALRTTQAINLILNEGDGEIWGGGGGGGSGSGGACSGGGGAGYDPGQSGDTFGTSGSPGTTEAGGEGGDNGSGHGGDGGGPGLAGQGGSGIGSNGSGGAAGGAIDGVSLCTKTGTGDIRGSQIN